MRVARTRCVAHRGSGIAGLRAAAFALAAALAVLPARAAAAATAGSTDAGEARAAREVHGSSDAFALPGVALAWGVLRGRDETSTRVTIRIDADPARFATVEVVGVDPFGGGRKLHLSATPIGGSFDFRASRVDFADYPRTELRFAGRGTGEAMPGGVTVFYQGVPDTTPEFDDPARLDAYLEARIAKARAGAGGRP